ncbi:hypothetical protein ABFT80_22995 [Mesorhizobium sp. SB112]
MSNLSGKASRPYRRPGTQAATYLFGWTLALTIEAITPEAMATSRNWSPS